MDFFNRDLAAWRGDTDRIMSRQKVFIILAVVVLMAGAAITSLLIRNRPKPEVVIAPEPRRFVRTMLLKKQDKTFWVKGFGTVRPKTELSIAPEVSGKVADRSAGFRTGGFIKKGDVLFQIDPADYKLAIERRRAEIAQLRADIARLRQEEKNHQADLDIAERQMELVSQEMERNERLRRQGVISSGQYDQSQQNFLRQERTVQSIMNVLALLPVQLRQKRAALSANQSELKGATLQLSRTKIVAPFDARVRETSLEIGDFVSVGKSVGKIYDVSALEVPVSLPVEDARWAFRRNREIPFPRSQEEVNSFFPAARVSWNQFGKKFEWTGRVSLVDSGLDESTRALTLVVEISEPMKNWIPGKHPPLFVGMFVEVNIEGVTMPGVFVIPRTALRERDHVYLLDDGKLRIQKVEVIRKAQDEVVIRNGVDENARIILSAIPDPVSGMKLTAQNGIVDGTSAQ